MRPIELEICAFGQGGKERRRVIRISSRLTQASSALLRGHVSRCFEGQKFPVEM